MEHLVGIIAYADTQLEDTAIRLLCANLWRRNYCNSCVHIRTTVSLFDSSISAVGKTSKKSEHVLYSDPSQLEKRCTLLVSRAVMAANALNSNLQHAMTFLSAFSMQLRRLPRYQQRVLIRLQ